MAEGEIVQGNVDSEYAKHELVEGNLRVVVSIAKKYAIEACISGPDPGRQHRPDEDELLDSETARLNCIKHA